MAEPRERLYGGKLDKNDFSATSVHVPTIDAIILGLQKATHHPSATSDATATHRKC